MVDKNEISLKQETAIVALIGGATRSQAAKAASVDVATIYRWFKQPAFVTAIKAARKTAFDANLEDLFSLTRAANQTLRRLMKKQMPEAIQIRAAAIVWSSIIRARDLEISEQLDELAKQIAVSKKFD